MLHQFGSFELDERRFELRHCGKPVVVQRQVLETIAYFVKNPDRLVTKDELVAGPWKGIVVSDAALAQTIMVARKALTARGDRSPLIQTVRGKGYRFVGEVTTSVTSDASSPSATRPPVTSAEIRRPNSSSSPRPAFLGRERELDAMVAAAARATEGCGNLLLLGGDPGIGKTSLLERFAQTVTGAEVLWGRCWEGGGAPAFWPWLEIIRGYVDLHGDDAIALMETDASDIVRWLPELRRKVADAEAAPDLESAQARFRTFDSVTRFLRRAGSSHPLILIIDDLHAADEASVLLLQFMSRTLVDTRLLIVASFRDLEVRSRPVLASFLGGPLGHAVRIELSGLTEHDVGALFRSGLDQPVPVDLVRRVFKATHGNPFLVTEVRRTVLANVADGQLEPSRLEFFRIPAQIADIVRRHLEHLPSSTVRTLAAAAVIGREFDLPLLRELCGSEPEHAVDDLEPALLEGVINESRSAPGIYAFSHGLIRETLYQDLPPIRRLALHFSAAELLEHQQVSDYAMAFQIAHHYFAGAAHKGADKAFEWALRAAEKARGIFAYELASEHYGRALQALALAGRSERKVCEILLLLADAQRLSGQATEAIATFRQVESVGRSRGLGALAAKALLGCAEVMRDGAGMDETLHQRMEEILETLPAGDDPLRARVLAAMSFASFLTRPLGERVAMCEEASAMARRLNDRETLAVVLAWSHWTTSQGSRPLKALEVATEMIQVATAVNDGERLLDAHLWRLCHLLALGRAHEFDAAAKQHASLAARLHHPVHSWWAKVVASTKAFIAGQLTLAESLAKEALDQGLPLQGFVAEGVFGVQLLTISLEKDGESQFRDLEQVRQIARKVLEIAPAYRPWQAGLAIISLEAGRTAEAREGFERFADEELSKLPDDANRLTVLATLSRLARALGDAPRATVLYDEWERHEGTQVHIGPAGYWGPVSHYRGIVAAAMGNLELARTHIEKAIIESQGMASPVWTAWAQIECGALLSKSKHALERDRGVGLVRSALATARKLGLAKLDKAAKAALRELR